MPAFQVSVRARGGGTHAAGLQLDGTAVQARHLASLILQVPADCVVLEAVT
jgi:hypothetical protein